MDPTTPVWQMYGLPQPATSPQLIPPSQVNQQLMSSMGGQQQEQKGLVGQSFDKAKQNIIDQSQLGQEYNKTSTGLTSLLTGLI